MYRSVLLLFVVILIFGSTNNLVSQPFDLRAYIEEKRPEIEKIYQAAANDSASWEKLAYFCDTFGPRLTGSENLRKAISWSLDKLKEEGFTNVHAEEVNVPHWVRGNEYCKLMEPREADIPMLGLGGSIGTPKEGITAPVLVVKDFAELKKRASEAKGKIVVYNVVFQHYGQAVQYRWKGAIEAAKLGAVASLVRAVSPMSHRNAHTGSMGYNDTIPKIPHAAIPQEDAMMLERMQERGQNPIVKLYMEAEMLPDAISHNVIAEFKGSEHPDEYIAIGGHSDSWDVGTGAHDDASGCISTWEAMKLLKELNMRPARTIRLVFWTNEENGQKGGPAYAENHGHEKHPLAFEFDSGVFPPSQIRFSAPDSMFKIVKAFEPLFRIIEDSINVVKRGGGVDIRELKDMGVPAMSLNTDDQGTYFWYHHSPKDTPDKIDPHHFNQCVAAIASAIYLYADLPFDLPNQLQVHGTK